jgi:cell wall assembly regulator SMI1
MQALWDRFERWLVSCAPAEALASLGPAASDAEIVEFEALLCVTLPADVRASYRIHNGQRTDAFPRVDGLIDTRTLLSLAEIRHEWTVWEEILDSGAFNGKGGAPKGPVRPDWWHPRWIPITNDDAGNHECLDLAPAPGGAVGQVISFRRDDQNRIVRAPSFAAWFDAYVTSCERGEFAYSEALGGIAKVV